MTHKTTWRFQVCELHHVISEDGCTIGYEHYNIFFSEGALKQVLHPSGTSVAGEPEVWEVPTPSVAESLQKVEEMAGNNISCHFIDTDKEYNVLDIVQKYKKKYKVKWEDYSESWEPEENVKHLLVFSWTFNSKKRKKTGKK